MGVLGGGHGTDGGGGEGAGRGEQVCSAEASGAASRGEPRAGLWAAASRTEAGGAGGARVCVAEASGAASRGELRTGLWAAAPRTEAGCVCGVGGAHATTGGNGGGGGAGSGVHDMDGLDDDTLRDDMDTDTPPGRPSAGGGLYDGRHRDSRLAADRRDGVGDDDGRRCCSQLATSAQVTMPSRV